MTSLNLALDPGKVADPAALVIVERLTVAGGPDRYVIRHAEQWDLGTPHTVVASDAVRLKQSTGGDLFYDATGIGEVYHELFRMAHRSGDLNYHAYPVLITGGSTYSDEGVSKEYLVRKFEAKLSTGLIVVAETCRLKDVLRHQLERFSYQINRRGNATYEAMREKDHDDLLTAVMLATLYRRSAPSGPRYVAPNGKTYESLAEAVVWLGQGAHA